MICGLNTKLYDLEDASDGAVVSASTASGFEIVTFEKAAAITDVSRWYERNPTDTRTLTQPARPSIHFLQTEGSFSSSIVLIRINVEDFLVGA